MTAPRWSVVIPAFNEASRLPAYLDEVVAYLEGRDEPYEVLVADDGSRDETPLIVEKVARAHPEVLLLRSERNQGKGAAVRRGMLAARGALRLFADADGATPIGELARLEQALQAGADIAIGSRVLPSASATRTSRPHRVFAGRIFNWLVGHAGLHDVADSQCGFKAFTATAAERLFGALATAGFGFDVEILLRAQAAGYRIAEVPVSWHDQPGSKVHVLSSGPAMLGEILLTRLRLLSGR